LEGGGVGEGGDNSRLILTSSATHVG
jgi:hypothetical protein